MKPVEVEKRLLSREEACKYVGLGLNRGVKFCNESGARIQIGNRAMYDKKQLDRFIDSQTCKRNRKTENP